MRVGERPLILMLAFVATQQACGARSSLGKRRLQDTDLLDQPPNESAASGATPGSAPFANPEQISESPVQNEAPTAPNALPSLPTPHLPTAPTPAYDGWASCLNPLRLDFAAGSGGTYTSFSDDAVDTVNTGCGVGKDVVFSWTAPSDGYFSFSAPNTEYDVSIALLANLDTCSPSLACAYGRVGESTAYLEQYASVGETFGVALESTDVGRFSLTVEPIALPRQCKPEYLAYDTQVTVTGDFVRESQANAFGSYCKSGRRAVPFVYIPPCTGSYRVTAPAVSFDTVLIAARDCEATAHECNNDSVEMGTTAHLDLSWKEGQPVMLFLAAHRNTESGLSVMGASDYTLTIENLGCAP